MCVCVFSARLIACEQCERFKKNLSANKTVPVNIESIFGEDDFRGTIDRDDFEAMASGLLSRMMQPVREAMELAS